MKQKLFLDQKGCQWRILPIQFRQTKCSKIRDIHKNRCLQLQEGPRDLPLCSTGVICRGWGVGNMQHTTFSLLKTYGTPEFLEFLQLSHHSFRSVLLSFLKTFISKLHYFPKPCQSCRRVQTRQTDVGVGRNGLGKNKT